MSASIFSLLAYLVLYIQGVLGFSAVQSGFRLVLLSAMAFVFAALAGRLTEKVPTKLLIGPGFLVLGVALCGRIIKSKTALKRSLSPGFAILAALLLPALSQGGFGRLWTGS